ncbi:trypsin-like peptidase domain-containing protein [Candidatus Saccharibacteria bacterium]|nr:trypsin-like peptidase domain-containing protein [Candidatus Saccharibacteria bacterium]
MSKKDENKEDKKGEIAEEAIVVEISDTKGELGKQGDEYKKSENTDTDKKCNSEKHGCGHNKVTIVLAVLALVFGIAGCAGTGVFAYLYYQNSSTTLTYFSSGVDGNSANFVEGSIADVADKVSASVVSITTSTKATSYFGQSYTSSAAGTGMIVSSDGYVLTNKHVIEGATKINVVLADGTTFEDVKVAAVDPLNDVAFLKVSGASDLTPATLGDSKTISVGQQVIAIGNALGQYQNTVTSGIVSGTNRSLTATDSTGSMSEELSDMIQTDAAINSGNSGGPLVNAVGEVIGINTATSSSAENMGFAIPISSVKGMLTQLTSSGKASRAYLGVYGMEITAESAKAYNLPVSAGAYLYSSSSYTSIVKDSPASKAGLKDKDIITEVNGVKIGEAGSLSSLIGEYKPGDTVELTVIREGEEMKIKVTLDAYKN